MSRFLFAAVASSILLAAEPTSAEDAPTRSVVTTPLQDDATLRHVTFLGSRFGWAVGDRGVVWRTEDGGASWQLVPMPVDVPLRSACFLTNHVGWVAGGAAVPHSPASAGVLLATRDGGKSWKRLGEHVLPRLFFVKFFGLQNGVVVGTATPANPSGVFTTRDGGETWQPVASARTEAWRTASFGSSASGVLVGKLGRIALFGGGRLLESRVAPLGTRTIHAATLSREDEGWVVGDRGLVLHTVSGGVSWEPPATSLPEGVEEIVDFHDVASRGQNVWLAGSPGSVVYHSPDGGRSWRTQRTGQSGPIHSLHFVDDQTGFAVGAFGQILRTANSGATWQAVRGSGRRTALLAIHAHPQRLSFRLLARESAEWGYRSAAHVVARRDIGPNASTMTDLDDRLVEAAAPLGAADVRTGSRLPLDLPGLGTNAERLRAEWNRRTEGKLEEVLVEHLAVLVKTWRPSVIVLDDAPPDDFATVAVREALLRAIDRAADPTLSLRHAEIAGLEPWRVKRVLSRLPAGSRGAMTVDAYESLPRTRTTVLAAAERSESLVTERASTSLVPESFRVLWDASGRDLSAPSPFAGIAIAADSDARRALRPLSEELVERERELVQRQRNVHAYAAQSFDDPRRAAGILAELRGVTRGMSDEQAATLLLSIAREQRRRDQWEHAEATYVELVERFPDQPAAREAARWLFQLWTSTETAWQRSRREGASGRRNVTNADAVVQRFERAIRMASHVHTGAGEPPPEVEADPWFVVNRRGALNESATNNLVNGYTWGADWRTGNVAGWQRRAAWIASLLRERSPETFESPEMQFPLATLYRQREAYGRADKIHRQFQRIAKGSAWQRLAANEVWMLNPAGVPPRETAACKRVATRPHLDGQLGDECWAKAKAIPLAASESDGPEQPVDPGGAYVLVAYDSTHLYLAASCPRDPRLPADGPRTAGRSHDADLGPFDRLTFLLDVDRDYTTWYEFRLDQRGCTWEACWEDVSWDPRWFVAAEHEDGRWIVEAAIPLDELVPHSPSRGHVWALGVMRTKPGLGVESWTQPPTAHPRPETFGLLRFQ